jgi:flagellar biosynthesis protein FliR
MRSVPTRSKIGLAAVTALLLFPIYGHGVPVPHNLIQLTQLILQECAIGLTLGFVANLVFSALHMAGEYISQQMGLSIASIIDPVTQTQSPVIGQIFFYFAAFLFLSLNIHHGLFAALDKSFHWIPPGHFIGEGKLTMGLMTERTIQLSGEVFVMALMIGVPVMGILLCSEIALGFVAKVMPQMNIFTVAMPLKVGLGLFLLVSSLPYLEHLLGEQYAQLIRVLITLYQ